MQNCLFGPSELPVTSLNPCGGLAAGWRAARRSGGAVANPRTEGAEPGELIGSELSEFLVAELEVEILDPRQVLPQRETSPGADHTAAERAIIEPLRPLPVPPPKAINRCKSSNANRGTGIAFLGTGMGSSASRRPQVLPQRGMAGADHTAAAPTGALGDSDRALLCPYRAPSESNKPLQIAILARGTGITFLGTAMSSSALFDHPARSTAPTGAWPRRT